MQVNYNRKKDLEFIINSWSFFFGGLFFFHSPFCELPEIVVEKLIVWDDYESEYTTFDVCGTEIRVLDEELAEALKQLPEQSRNIVLMFFFLDMSDSEIGEKLNINRSTSYRHRRNSLEEIRKQLKEKKTNEE